MLGEQSHDILLLYISEDWLDKTDILCFSILRDMYHLNEPLLAKLMLHILTSKHMLSNAFEWLKYHRNSSFCCFSLCSLYAHRKQTKTQILTFSTSVWERLLKAGQNILRRLLQSKDTIFILSMVQIVILNFKNCFYTQKKLLHTWLKLKLLAFHCALVI